MMLSLYPGRIEVLAFLNMTNNLLFLILLLITCNNSDFVQGTSLPASVGIAEKYTTVVQQYNTTCKRDIDCTHHTYPTYMRCVNGRCLCETHTFYDDYDEICRIRVLSQCKIKRTGSDMVQPCVRYGYCAFPVDHEGNELKTALHGSCTCRSGRNRSVNLTCSKGALPVSSIPNNHGLMMMGSILSMVWMSRSISR